MQKWLNRSIYHFGCGLEWAKGCTSSSYSPGGANVPSSENTLQSPVELECRPMPNVMAALPNIVAPSVECRKVWLMPTTTVPCSNAAKMRNPMKLAGVTQTPGLVHYIYTFGGSCLVTEFCQVQNSLCILQVLCSHILVALLQGT